MSINKEELSDEQLYMVCGGVKHHKNNKDNCKLKKNIQNKDNVKTNMHEVAGAGLMFGSCVKLTTTFNLENHFVNDSDNVIDIYEKIKGSELDLNINDEE